MIDNIIELATDYNELIIWLIIIFLLAIWIHPEEKNTQQKITNTDSNDENEYNFLATEESIPSQFDLAMAFISMKNLDQAISILKNLLNHPNLEISTKAEKILNTMSLNDKGAE